jgi:dihydrofolate reductase
MRVSAIVAMGTNRAIGLEGALPWRLPEDLKRFKRLTLGHTLGGGRRTYESIGRPLPGRRMVVLTRQPGWSAEGVQVARSLEEALELAAGDDEVFIAGGAEVYREALPRVQRLYLTVLERDYLGDAFFPEVDLSTWRLVEREEHPVSGQLPAYAFLTWER